MLTDFFFTLRTLGLPVSLHEWLLLVQALESGCVAPTLTDFYYVARAILVKDEAFFDHFDQAFAHYFRGAEEPALLKQKLLEWLQEAKELALSRAELKELEKLDMETLKKLFEERLREQRERHDGGNRWIGTAGTSPFGHSGYPRSGIRVGGEGGGRRAVQIAAERQFQEYRKDRVLDTRQIQVALKKLRIFSRAEESEELDLDETIAQTCRNGGDIELCFQRPRKNRVKLLLLMDVGGSMTPFAELVEKLFSAAHQLRHFKEFHYFYFHNCVYEQVYRKATMAERVPLPQFFQEYSPEHRLVVVGDATMDPGELLDKYGALYYYHRNETPGIVWLERLCRHFQRAIWLNPERREHWAGTTAELVGEIFPMFELTLAGLEEGVRALL